MGQQGGLKDQPSSTSSDLGALLDLTDTTSQRHMILKSDAQVGSSMARVSRCPQISLGFVRLPLLWFRQ